MVLERSRSGSRPDSCVRELELKCLALQGQVDEMEVGTHYAMTHPFCKVPLGSIYSLYFMPNRHGWFFESFME